MIFFIFVSAVGTTGSCALEAQFSEQLPQSCVHSDIFFTSTKYDTIRYTEIMKIGISACLLGYKVRYDGTDKRNDEILKLLKGHELVAICPEFRAFFPIPHQALEIREDKVYTSGGEEVSEKLSAGARLCLDKVRDCDFLILKQKSPSCGNGQIYDGTFSGKLISGKGIFTRICLEEGFRVYSEDQIEAIQKELL